MPFSFSQLSTYQACPKQYEFANVKKIPRQISAGESFGSSVHNTLSKWGKMEMGNNDSGSDQLELFAEPSVQSDLTLDTLIDLWHQSFIVAGYDSKEDADAARIKGEAMMQHYMEWWGNADRSVLAVEKGFGIEVDVNTIKGRFDRVEDSDSGTIIIDYKTGGVRTQEDVDKDLQLSIYALASQEVFGKPCAELLLLFLHEDGITEVVTRRSPEQLSEAREHIASLAERIDDELFEATPSEKVCHRCPYKDVCNSSVM